MGLKAYPCFQVTLKRGDKISPGGGGAEEQPKERMGTESCEGRNGIRHGLTASGCLFSAADPSQAFSQQLEK